MKAILSAYYRFNKQHYLIATEAGRFNSDFLTVKKGVATEIEIKVSKIDLNNDFKKPKHRFYESGRSPHVPTYFYFCVPQELVEHALAKCIDKPYGVMMVKTPGSKVGGTWNALNEDDLKKRVLPLLEKRYKDNEFEFVSATPYARGLNIKFKYRGYMPWKDRVKIVKRAKKLHTRPADPRMKKLILARLASEMANLRIENETNKPKDKQ